MASVIAIIDATTITHTTRVHVAIRGIADSGRGARGSFKVASLRFFNPAHTHTHTHTHSIRVKDLRVRVFRVRGKVKGLGLGLPLVNHHIPLRHLDLSQLEIQSLV